MKKRYKLRLSQICVVEAEDELEAFDEAIGLVLDLPKFDVDFLEVEEDD